MAYKCTKEQRTTSQNRSKYFPESVSEVKKQSENLLEPIQLNDGDNNVHYANSFRYLGSTITTNLKKDKEIKI